MKLVPLPEGDSVQAVLSPETGLDVGAGKGKERTVTLKGGVVGLIFDCRGRQPFGLPEDPAKRLDEAERVERGARGLSRRRGGGVAMAHSYTPGLKVAAFTTVRRERRLPLTGSVVVTKGQSVQAETIVARTELPGNVQTVNAANLLGVLPEDVPECLVKPIGSTVKKGEVIAESKILLRAVPLEVRGARPMARSRASPR